MNLNAAFDSPSCCIQSHLSLLCFPSLHLCFLCQMNSLTERRCLCSDLSLCLFGSAGKSPPWTEKEGRRCSLGAPGGTWQVRPPDRADTPTGSAGTTNGNLENPTNRAEQGQSVLHP